MNRDRKRVDDCLDEIIRLRAELAQANEVVRLLLEQNERRFLQQ